MGFLEQLQQLLACRIWSPNKQRLLHQLHAAAPGKRFRKINYEREAPKSVLLPAAAAPNFPFYRIALPPNYILHPKCHVPVRSISDRSPSYASNPAGRCDLSPLMPPPPPRRPLAPPSHSPAPGSLRLDLWRTTPSHSLLTSPVHPLLLHIGGISVHLS